MNNTNCQDPEINTSKVKLFIEDNALNLQFFSKDNLALIQQQIIEEVYKQSKNQFRISPQDEEQLIIVMRSMYLMNSNNLPDDIDNQVLELNNTVLEYCVPNILSNILQYISFVKDRESAPFMPNPMNDNLYIPLESNTIN